MKRNVNFMLLLLVLTVLVGTVAITTYFQSTYKNVSQDLATKSKQLDVVSSNFSTKVSELNRTYTDLQLKALDKEKLDQLYTNLTVEKEKVDTELSATKTLLTNTLSLLQETKDDLADANYKLLAQEQELSELNVKVGNLANTINSLQDQVDSLKNQLCDEKKAQGKTC